MLFASFVFFVLLDVDGFDSGCEDGAAFGEQFELETLDNPANLDAFVIDRADQLGIGVLRKQLAAADLHASLRAVDDDQPIARISRVQNDERPGQQQR